MVQSFRVTETMMGFLEQMFEKLPLIARIRSLFPTSKSLEVRTFQVYESIIEFFASAIKYFRSNPISQYSE